ncbi:hypothetical protein [Roseibium sp. M-1]
MSAKNEKPGIGLDAAGEKPAVSLHPILEILDIILVSVRIATLQAGSVARRKTDRS